MGQRLRLAAALSLAKLGDVRAVEPLVRALPNRDALPALLALGKPAVLPVIEELRSTATRSRAMTVLVAFGKVAVDPLIEVARNDSGKYARLAALKVLSEIEDERGAAVVETALKVPELEFTLAAYRYLIRTGRTADESRLINALRNGGNNEMAHDFVTSGNPALKAAAEEWVRKTGGYLGVRTSDLPPVFWGAVNPSPK